MKRKWHIRTRILITLAGLTCGVLLVVALAFNLSIRGYIRSRVSTQLETVSQNAAEQREEGPRKPGGNRRFDDHPDRIMGTSGNTLILDKDGTLLFVMHGDGKVGRELEEYFAGRTDLESIQYEVVNVESGTYAVSVTDDPVTEGQYLLTYVDVTSLMALTGRINLVLILVILAAILLSVLLSMRFAKSFSEPVQDLSDFAAKIGGGDLTAREMDFRDREFDDLAASMNKMAMELSEAKLKQDTFFQNVSHELRTPLTSIRGNAEGIVYGVMEPQNAAKVILSESDKLGGMVEDILYLSRMGKSVPENEARPLDIREVLSLCVSEQRTEAERQGVGFGFDFDEEPVMYAVREQDAERLFGNLISNAIRYAESQVTLTCRKEDDSICICVSDDGPGIAGEDLPYIFERFYKGKNGKHGIGLAIAKAIVENYQGTITAQSDNGAVFEVRFPDRESV